ncbi:MAG: hypothetical protein RR213_04820, partial [Raoultibacter sp.]
RLLVDFFVFVILVPLASIVHGAAYTRCSSNICKHHKTFGEKNLQFVMNSKSSDMNDNKMASPGYYLPKIML